MKKNAGFTLIELMVVIGAIALIAGIVLINVNSAKDKSKITKAQSDLGQIFKALEQMAIDTGKWPGGCTIGQTASVYFAVETTPAGLTVQPGPGVTQSPCQWNAGEVASWRGPYISLGGLVDPWGTAYHFDGSYTSGSQTFAALVSWGPNKQIDVVDSDNIFVRLR